MKQVIVISLFLLSLNLATAQTDTSQAEAIKWLSENPAEKDQRVKFFDFTNEVEFDFGIRGENDSLEVYWKSSYFDENYNKWVYETKSFAAADVFSIKVRPYVKGLFEITVDFRDVSKSKGYSSVYFIFDNQEDAEETFDFLKAFTRTLESKCFYTNEL
ncbi:MAG: hypothetical protein JXQ87_14860 [Bacteroidia bacterium]